MRNQVKRYVIGKALDWLSDYLEESNRLQEVGLQVGRAINKATSKAGGQVEDVGETQLAEFLQAVTDGFREDN